VLTSATVDRRTFRPTFVERKHEGSMRLELSIEASGLHEAAVQCNSQFCSVYLCRSRA